MLDGLTLLLAISLVIKWKPTKENQRESDKLQCKYETIVILSDGNVTATLTLNSFI